jgi:hypothetical protein
VADLTAVLPPTTDSPVRPLLPIVARSIFSVAPERVEQLREACRDLRIEIRDTHRFVCRYDAHTQAIELSTGMVEVCWATAHAYVTLYDRVLAGRRETTQRIVELGDDPVVRDAMALLTWAFKNLVDNTELPWPTRLIRPVETPTAGSPENVADELAVCTIAFLIHHELAHHRLNHSAIPRAATPSERAWSIEQERDADYEAAEWVLGKVQEDDPRFMKRALGVATALGIMTAYGIHTGDHDGLRHPRSFDRLIHTLDRHLPSS